MWYKVNKRLIWTKQVRPVWKLEDSFSWTSLDTSNRAIDKIANIGTVTVNNSLILSSPGTWSWNAWWPIVKTIKTLTGNEKKIIIEYTCTSTIWWFVSIWWYASNWVSESSYYKCNGNLPICLFTPNAILATKSSTSYSWTTDNAFYYTNYTTTLSTPFTIKWELDITNRTVKTFNGSSLLASTTLPSNVNLNDWIGKPVASIHAVWWNSRNVTISNISITVEY